ncbi:MAG TPA: hypothetical protein EYG51_15065 [Pseudomonadales bacterium]|nr:hypothetical protein [Pseudomonadales bacterium]
MTNEDVKGLVDLRSYVISAHNSLAGRREPSAMIKERDVAITLANIIKGIDELLKDHVRFESPE